MTNKDQQLIEARARIMWGDDPEKVIDDLVANGLDQILVSMEIREYVDERMREIRISALRQVLSGVLLGGASLVWLLIQFSMNFIETRAGMFCVLGVVGGAFMILSGVLQLLGGNVKGSLTELP